MGQAGRCSNAEEAKYRTTFQSLRFLLGQQKRFFSLSVSRKGKNHQLCPQREPVQHKMVTDPVLEAERGSWRVSLIGPKTAENLQVSLGVHSCQELCLCRRAELRDPEKTQMSQHYRLKGCQHATASSQTHMIRTSPNAATSRLDPSSCFVQTVLVLMASFIKCLRNAPRSLERNKVFLV